MGWLIKLAVFLCCIFTAALFADGTEDSSHLFRGTHFLASYCDCDIDALGDVDGLVAAMSHAVQGCGATILGTSSWVFPPNGLTMVFLLSESHASIHTWPEHGACFVDLFTCGNRCSAEKFDASLRAYLSPKEVSMKTLIRSQQFQEVDALQ